ncbi:MAG: hypothetical protein R3F35_09045 [Myxococcota bacterium]
MTWIGRANRITRACATWLLAVCTTALLAASLAAAPVAAEPGDLDALKAHWQGRYRELRLEEARLVETARLATKEYADSNRRNYRRSGVRHFHRTNANEAKAQLVIVRGEIEKLYDEVVEAGGTVNWFYEVDDEGIDRGQVEGLGVYADDGRFGGKGAYAPRREDGEPLGDDLDAARADDDGRNPRFSEDGDAPDDPASLGADDLPPFDYDAWRKNRGEYESKRAPERHLRPGDD